MLLSLFLFPIVLVLVLVSLNFHVDALSAVGPPTKTTTKYSGPGPSKVKTPENFLTSALEYPESEPPDFDVLSKTIEFATCDNFDDVNSMMASDYVFRGPIIGPITGKDVMETQQGFRIQDGYPDLDRRSFGFTIDPDNPYRCYWFERWEGTNTGDLKIGPIEMKATGKSVKLPTHVMSVHFNKEGKIRYAALSSPLDRFEGNTKGAGAVFGLLVGAGANSAYGPNFFFRLQQRLTHLVGTIGRNWSRENDIPLWWRSKSRGADPTDM